MKTLTLFVLCAFAILALAYAAPARIGSGVNLSGMEFGPSVLPGKAYTNYVLPYTKEVRTPYEAISRFTTMPSTFLRCLSIEKST